MKIGGDKFVIFNGDAKFAPFYVITAKFAPFYVITAKFAPSNLVCY